MTSDIAISTEQPHSGTHSARVAIVANPNSSSIELYVDLCKVNIQNKQVHAWLYIAGPSTLSHLVCELYGWGNGSEQFTPQEMATVPTNRWTQLRGPANQFAASSATRLAVNCSVNRPDLDWKGALYIDDVAVE